MPSHGPVCVRGRAGFRGKRRGLSRALRRSAGTCALARHPMASGPPICGVPRDRGSLSARGRLGRHPRPRAMAYGLRRAAVSASASSLPNGGGGVVFRLRCLSRADPKSRPRAHSLGIEEATTVVHPGYHPRPLWSIVSRYAQRAGRALRAAATARRACRRPAATARGWPCSSWAIGRGAPVAYSPGRPTSASRTPISRSCVPPKRVPGLLQTDSIATSLCVPRKPRRGYHLGPPAQALRRRRTGRTLVMSNCTALAAIAEPVSGRRALRCGESESPGEEIDRTA